MKAGTGKRRKRGAHGRLWDRTLVWLNEYLAFDVYPRQAPDFGFDNDDRLVAGTTPAATALQNPTAASILASRLVPATPRTIPVFSAGERIADIYDVQEVICRGDLNTVYRAHHVHWNTELIVKAPSPLLGALPRAVQQLALQAEEWVTIGVHPNIAACYYIHSFDGIPLQIIEYVTGGTLRAWMQHERRADLQLVLDLAVQICRAIEHAHGRGIIHGHLTPENVLLTPQGVPKVTDFGVRRAAPADEESASASPRTLRSDQGALMTAWRLMQAPAYVAPERWLDVGAVDAQTDIFALGVCLYELLVGQPPYASTSGPRCEPLDPSRLADPPLPEKVGALLKQCVDWRREWRPQTIDEIGMELSAVSESLFGDLGRTADQSGEADAWNNKAVSYFCAGKEVEADAAWVYALDANPAHLDTLFNFGITRWRRGTLADDGLVQQLETVAVRREDRWKAHYLLALIHLERGDRAAALTLLEQAASDRPGRAEVETALLDMRSGTDTAPRRQDLLVGHQGYVSSVCISADGRLGVSASHDQTALLWDLTTGRQSGILEGHYAALSCAFLTTDGQRALTGSDDQTMRLWDLSSGTCERVFEGHAGRIFSACLSGDGRLLLWAGNRSSEDVERVTVELWDAQGGRRIRTFEGHTSAVKSVALSTDGRRAATGSDDQTVRLWDVGTGECLHVLKGHRHFVSAVCFDREGKVLLSASWDQTLRLWSAQSGECLRTFTGHRALITSVCLSADGRWALSGSWDCTVRLWEVATGRCLRTFQGHTSLVTGVAVSADNRWAISGSWDCSVRFWELPLPPQEFCHLQQSSVAPADGDFRLAHR